MRAVLGIALCVALGACKTLTPSNSIDASAEKTAKGAETNCVDARVVTAIRDKLFDKAIEAAKPDKRGTQNLNNLRSALIGRIENPVLQGHDSSVRKTQCGGKIVFGLPPSVVKAFNGTTSLSADIVYSVQPAADKSGLVVEATGTESILQTLVDASQKKRVVKIEVPPPGGSPSSFPPVLDHSPSETSPPSPGDLSAVGANPSFSCAGGLTQVEKLICRDTMLSDQDRAMASAYREAKDRAGDSGREKLSALNQKYRARRNACADTSCIAATYDDWVSALYNWQPNTVE